VNGWDLLSKRPRESSKERKGKKSKLSWREVVQFFVTIWKLRKAPLDTVDIVQDQGRQTTLVDRLMPLTLSIHSDSLWRRWDILALLLVTFLGGIIRVWHLSIPGGFILDEFYASDACFYIGGPASVCRTDQEITTVHPPLAKWLMGVGIWLLGFRPAGWRIVSVIVGTLTIAALYLLARKLLNSTLGATVASGLLAFDFLHFVFSRTAMLDIFVTFFIVVAFLFLVYDRERLFGLQGGAAARPGHRFLLLAGIVGGAAGASKWSAWPCLAAMILLTVGWEFEARRGDGIGRAARQMIREVAPYLLLCLVALPVILYIVTFAGRLSGTFFAWPWADDSWVRAFVERQMFMFKFHRELSGSHPYTSPAWSWLLLKRPVLLYFRETGEGIYQVILGLGSPLVWWSSIAALIYLTFDRFRCRTFESPISVILAGFIACYGPWLLLGHSRQQVFLYYLLPAIPFMCLALGAVAARCGRSAAGKQVVAVFAACSIALFLYYYPLLAGRPLPYLSWEARMLFRNCDRPQGERLHPQTVLGPPPHGWCWP
jgi:dolichyl-phosphate-mannose--protein O-mannosyl transferase